MRPVATLLLAILLLPACSREPSYRGERASTWLVKVVDPIWGPSYVDQLVLGGEDAAPVVAAMLPGLSHELGVVLVTRLEAGGLPWDALLELVDAARTVRNPGVRMWAYQVLAAHVPACSDRLPRLVAGLGDPFAGARYFAARGIGSCATATKAQVPKLLERAAVEEGLLRARMISAALRLDPAGESVRRALFESYDRASIRIGFFVPSDQPPREAPSPDEAVHLLVLHLGLAGETAIEGALDPLTDPDRITGALTGGGVPVRDYVELLLRLGEPARAGLITRLDSPYPVLRASAALVLVRFGEEAAVALERACGDEHPAVRVAAARGLADLGWSVDALRPAILGALRSADLGPRTADLALALLGPDPPAIEEGDALVVAVGNRRAAVRRTALHALARRGAPEQVRRAGESALFDPDPLVAEEAFYTVLRHPGVAKTLVGELLAAGDREEPVLRELAILCLAAAVPGSPEALASIRRASRDRHTSVRRMGRRLLENGEGVEVATRAAEVAKAYLKHRERQWSLYGRGGLGK